MTGRLAGRQRPALLGVVEFAILVLGVIRTVAGLDAGFMQPSESAPQASALVAALEAYDGHDAFRLPGSVANIRIDLNKTGRAWVSSGPPADRTRRAQVVALAAFDAASAAGPVDWREARALLEWACGYLDGWPTSTFERDWVMAVAVVAEQHRDEGYLLDGSCGALECGQLSRLVDHFPDDAELRRLGVFGRKEVNVVTHRPGLTPRVLVSAPPPGWPFYLEVFVPGAEDRVKRTLANLLRLAEHPAQGPAPRLRLGILEYELGQLKESRQDLQLISENHEVPEAAYLANLVLGFGFLATGQDNDARAAFAAAVAIDPAIRSGAVELATADFLTGRRDDASATLDRAFLTSPPHDDPWQWSCADCLNWYARVAALHAEVHR